MAIDGRKNDQFFKDNTVFEAKFSSLSKYVKIILGTRILLPLQCVFQNICRFLIKI